MHYNKLMIAVSVFEMLATAPADSSETELSSQAESLIAPVHQAFRNVAIRQSEMAPAVSTSEKLVRLGQLDRAGRDTFQMIDLSRLPPDQRLAASDRAWSEINAQDLSDEEEIKKLLPEKGWFTISLYGGKASNAAWSIVQHQTNDPSFMEQMLNRIEEAARRNEVNKKDYAMLVDRVSWLEHKPQLYGNQFVCVNHKWTLYDLEDPQNVDQRRKELGLTTTEEQVKAKIATYAPCFFHPAASTTK